MKIQFTVDKKSLPILIFTLIFSLFLMLYSFWGHIQVYALKNAGSIEATVENTYRSRSNTKKHQNNLYLHYTFEVDGISYEGKARTFKHYNAGESVKVYYNYQMPEKNGLLKIYLLLFLLGLAFGGFTLAAIKNLIQHYRKYKKT